MSSIKIQCQNGLPRTSAPPYVRYGGPAALGGAIWRISRAKWLTADVAGPARVVMAVEPGAVSEGGPRTVWVAGGASRVLVADLDRINRQREVPRNEVESYP